MLAPLSGQLTPLARSRRVEFSPALLSGLGLWLQADALGLANGAAVATWPDSSGLGNDAIQSTPFNQPAFGTNRINGLPAVVFSGVPNFLTCPLARTQPYEVFAVCQPSLSGNNQYMLDGSATNTGVLAFPGTAIPGDSCILYAGGVVASTGSIAVPQLIAAAYNGASSTLTVNGVTSTGNVGSSNTSGTTIGAAPNGTGGFEGWIAELLIYTATLADADRNRVTDYLNRKYLVY